MGSKKISNLELDQLVREGNGVSEIGRKLGDSKGAVSKRLKALNVAITKDVTLHHAGEIAERKLDAIEQLQKISGYANELFDLLMRWHRGDDEMLQIPENYVGRVKAQTSRGTNVDLITCESNSKMTDVSERSLGDWSQGAIELHQMVTFGMAKHCQYFIDSKYIKYML
jgi:hypothetical protein